MSTLQRHWPSQPSIPVLNPWPLDHFAPRSADEARTATELSPVEASQQILHGVANAIPAADDESEPELRCLRK